MYHKVAGIISWIFVALVGVACGLTCYYYCWLSDWKQVWKVFAIIGFCVWGALGMFLDGLLALWMMDGYTTDDTSGDIKLGLVTLVIGGVVPGLLYLIFLGVGANSDYLERHLPHSTGSYGGDYTYGGKKKMPDYDPDDDPAIIKKSKPTGGSKKVIPSNKSRPTKKKIVK